MSKDRVIGVLLLIGSIVGIILYGWLLLVWTLPILQITGFVAVAAILGILAWIGWTMATTPPPAPIEPEAPTPTETPAPASEAVQPTPEQKKE